jgi:hypothetical protein
VRWMVTHRHLWDSRVPGPTDDRGSGDGGRRPLATRKSLECRGERAHLDIMQMRRFFGPEDLSLLP